MAINAFTQLAPQNTLGGFSGLNSTFAPSIFGQAVDRLGLQGAGAANPSSQLLEISQQQSQLLLDMMQMLMMLMAPAGSTAAGASGSATGTAPVSEAAGTGSSSSSAMGNAAATGDAAAASGGPKVQKFIDAALGKQGTRYVYGAAGPDTFDCSGLVAWALKQAGSSVGRMSAEGYRTHYKGAEVSKDQLKPGDLVFFSHTGGAPATHIEIYLGNGETMGAHTESMPNGKAKLNTKTLIMAARPPELQG